MWPDSFSAKKIFLHDRLGAAQWPLEIKLDVWVKPKSQCYDFSRIVLTEFLELAWYLLRGEDEKQVVAPDECLGIIWKKTM